MLNGMFGCGGATSSTSPAQAAPSSNLPRALQIAANRAKMAAAPLLAAGTTPAPSTGGMAGMTGMAGMAGMAWRAEMVEGSVVAGARAGGGDNSLGARVPLRPEPPPAAQLPIPPLVLGVRPRGHQGPWLPAWGLADVEAHWPVSSLA